MALALSSGTAHRVHGSPANGTASCALSGMLGQATALPLPATATFAVNATRAPSAVRPHDEDVDLMADFPYPSGFHLPTITSYQSWRPRSASAINRPFVTARPRVGPCLADHQPGLLRPLHDLGALSGQVRVLGQRGHGRTATSTAVSTAPTPASCCSTPDRRPSPVPRVPQAVAVGPYLLEPGTYYMALVDVGDHGQVLCCGTGRDDPGLQAAGCAQVARGAAAGGVVHPGHAQFVQCRAAPLFGISSRVYTLI